MHSLTKSLSFRIGSIIVLVELITLTIAGIVYLNNFSAQVDNRLEAAVSLPGKLMNAGLLDFNAMNDSKTIQSVVGEDVKNALVVATNNMVFFASNASFMGRDIHTLEGINVAAFDQSVAQVAPVQSQEGEVLAYISPIFGSDGRTPRFFAYIEVGNSEAIIQKNAIAQLFVLGTAGTVLVTSLIIFFSFNLTVLRRLLDAVHVLKQVEDGDLSVRVTSHISADEIGQVQQGLNSMVARLQSLVGNLEERVTERTRDLTIAADVSSQIAKVLNLDELLPKIVQQTRDGYNFYSVSIFLYDDKSNKVSLQATTSREGDALSTGSQMFSLEDQGLVPRAMRERRSILVNNVNESPDHYKNPLLPDTQSELAIPMVIGDKLVGVLDLQSEIQDRFSENEQRTLRTLAEQIGIAVENARLYSAQLQATDELRALDNMKSQFLASMSHELRTPLNAILNFSKFVGMGVYGTVTDPQKDAMSKIVGSAQHLLSLINDVLDITKIESGMMQLFIEDDVNLQEELQSVIATAETLLSEKPVELIQDIDEDLALMVGDRRRIRQILLNLVSNACKFTETGSVTISAKKRGEEVLFAIIDTGPGISQEDLDLIFEPFQQAQNGIRHAGGTGLGLPISKKLVEAHYGRLWVETEAGEGATFFVLLPIHSTQLVELFMLSQEKP